MQIRKTYKALNPGLLQDEIKDFMVKQGLEVAGSKMETYVLPDESANFMSRGTMTFRTRGDSGQSGKECVRAHVVGSTVGETKLMLDIDESLFPRDRITAFQDDMDFVFGSFEVK